MMLLDFNVLVEVSTEAARRYHCDGYAALAAQWAELSVEAKKAADLADRLTDLAPGLMAMYEAAVEATKMAAPCGDDCSCNKRIAPC